jgi:hypothetical protein
MPLPNLPDPDKIPDMTLDKRTDKPAPAQPTPDVASLYQPERETVKQKSAEPVPASTRPREWQEGDDVLAPWEPFFLYPGIIKQIKIDDARGDQALISFDDGGEGWVFVYSLCPLEVHAGQEVQVRDPRSNHYAPAKVIEVDGKDYHIRYADGATEWTTITSMRIPCIENGPGAVSTKLAPWQTPPVAASPGVPSWVWTVGLIVLMAMLRFGCRAMTNP